MTAGDGAGEDVRAVLNDGSDETVSFERSDEIEGEGRRGGWIDVWDCNGESSVKFVDPDSAAGGEEALTGVEDCDNGEGDRGELYYDC